MEPSDRSKYDPRIDAFRAMAFLLVAIVHFSVPVWTNAMYEPHLVVDTVVLSLIHCGWIGVPIFLFVSGYSLALGKCSNAYTLDKKQFFKNRFLRIFPVWIACILLLTFFHHIGGMTVITLFFLQTQDIPPSTAYGIAWSISLEFTCYLLFPVFLSNVANRRNVLVTYGFLFLSRFLVCYLPEQTTFFFSYSTVFGGATIFLSGMLAASLKPLPPGNTARLHAIAGVVLLCAFAVVVREAGGYQTAAGKPIHLLFVIFPETLSLIVFLLLRGFLVERQTSLLYMRRSGIGPAIGQAIFRAFVHIGKVSYSGYMFSMFVLDFSQRAYGFIEPHGWRRWLAFLICYISTLTLFATTSYHAIELPFLSMRARYVRSEPTADLVVTRAAAD